MTSNVFSLPQATDTIYAARPLLNDSMQALLQNFYSTVPPTANSVIIDDAASLQTGMLWVQEGNAVVSDRVFIYNPSVDTHPLYPGFTRQGVGIVSQNTFADANAALSNGYFQAGELISIKNLDRVFLVKHDLTGLVDLGTNGAVEEANNAYYLGGANSSQYVRTDVSSNISANLTITSTGSLKLANLTANAISGDTYFSTATGNLQFSASNTAPFLTVNGTFKSKGYTETAVQLSGTTPTIDCSAGNIFYISLTGDTTFAFSNVPAYSTTYTATAIITANASSVYNITWPAAVRWPGGVDPIRPAEGETDIYNLTTLDNGTTWYGIVVGEAFA